MKTGMKTGMNSGMNSGMIVRLLVGGLGLGWAAGQDHQVPLVIDPPVTTKLAVSNYYPRSLPNPETEASLLTFNQVLLDDLKFSSFFEIPSRSFYPPGDAKLPQEIDFDAWDATRLEPDYLAFGNLQVYSSGAVVEAFLYDSKTREQLLGRRYTVSDPSMIRQVAHQVADQIVYQLSSGASRGVARTQIAFSALKGNSKEIYVMDYDGENVRTITANGGINKFPEWATDNSKLVFITKLPRKSAWELWIQDLTGGRTVIPTPTSYVSSPTLSPDGTEVVFSARSRSRVDSDIFVSELDGGRRRRLTSHASIDTSPSWSPSGQQIAFVSDRSGTPQVWMVDVDGSNTRRLVDRGGHCDSPSWSPDGSRVLYSWQAPRRAKHDIFLVEVVTGNLYQLTSGRGSNENPHWSPDGGHIAFQSDRSGTKQIFVMNLSGNNLRQLTAYGINESPAWSSYVSEVR